MLFRDCYITHRVRQALVELSGLIWKNLEYKEAQKKENKKKEIKELIELFRESLKQGELDDRLRQEVHTEMVLSEGFQIYAKRGERQEVPDRVRKLYNDICLIVPMANMFNEVAEDEPDSDDDGKNEVGKYKIISIFFIPG